jgi:thioredoxin reductase
METITKESGGFVVKTSKGSYNTKNVLLAIGRRGTPRKLGVPGEAQSKVVYSLVDAAQYQGQHVLVVGGGDSAAEAALAIAAERGTTVTVSCRGDEIFTRPKEKNRQRLKQEIEKRRLTVYTNANVKEIGTDLATLVHEGKDIVIENNAVIVCVGGTLPTPMLKEIGVMVDTCYGTAVAR